MLVSPGSDDPQIGRKRRHCQFEPPVIIAFAGRPVRDGVPALPPGDLNHAFGDERSGDTGAKEILALVNRPSADHWKYEVSGEFFLQIINIDFRGACSLG